MADRDAIALPVRPSVAARVLDLLIDALAERIADAVVRVQLVRAEREGRDLGYLSQKTLPPWIHPDSYVEACRSGAIPGAKLWKRQWLAPKEAVLAWVASESREAAANPGLLDPDSLEGLVAASGGTLRLNPR